MDSDRIEGQVKEAEGTVAGDESLRREGELQGAPNASAHVLGQHTCH